jgi:hypothetical protein
MPYIPAGRPNWREHWAQLLVDVAQYGWFLREGPFPLPHPLRYECIELTGLAGRRSRRQAVIVVSGKDGRRWITRVRLPPPPTVDLTAAPLTIREWISEGAGHVLGDGSTAKQLGV